MNSYEVTLIEKRTKNVLVTAGSSADALEAVECQYMDEEINLDECKFELDDLVCREARSGVFDIEELTYGRVKSWETCCECDMDYSFDRIFECENCANRFICSNETKYEHLSEILIDEFKERMVVVYNTYGEDQ